MRQGWGSEHPAFRQIFTTSFFLSGAREQMDWVNELQRQTTSPDNAADILSALGDVDVRNDLPRVHSRRSWFAAAATVVSVKDGIELAAGIQGARFLSLESSSHLLLESEPAWTGVDPRELGGFMRDRYEPRALLGRGSSRKQPLA